MPSSSIQPRVDPEFAALLPPLTKQEKADLEESLVREGCRDPVVVWSEDQLILDGYNRHEICERLGIPYGTTSVEHLHTRADARHWICRNQLARRNLTDAARDHVIALLYEAATSGRGGGRDREPAARLVAEATGLSERTVRRAVRHNRIISEVTEAAPDVRDRIHSGDIPVSQAQVEQLAVVPPERLVEGLRHGRPVAEVIEEVLDELPPPAGTVDANGRAVPERVRDTFVAAEDFKAFLSEARALKRRLAALVEGAGGACLGPFSNEVGANLNSVIREVAQRAPHAVCPACNGTGRGDRCRTCNGYGWVDKFNYENTIPEEVIRGAGS